MQDFIHSEKSRLNPHHERFHSKTLALSILELYLTNGSDLNCLTADIKIFMIGCLATASEKDAALQQQQWLSLNTTLGKHKQSPITRLTHLFNHLSKMENLERFGLFAKLRFQKQQE